MGEMEGIKVSHTESPAFAVGYGGASREDRENNLFCFKTLRNPPLSL
jgi:hypothetical protein